MLPSALCLLPSSFANPKAVIGQAFDVEFAEEVNVQVLEENPTFLYFVLPMSPMQIANELSEEELEEIAGGRKKINKKTNFNYAVGGFLGGVSLTLWG